MFVSLPANISYLCGFPSRDAYLLVSGKRSVYFTDSRYTEEAARYLKGKDIRLEECNGFVFRRIAETAAELKLGRLGFEERFLPFAEFSRIKDYACGRIELFPAHGIIEKFREVKDPGEIEKIRAGLKVTSLAFKYMKKILSPGMREIEAAAEFERFVRYHGAGGAAFDTIVASGPGSSQPHHLSGQAKLKKDAPVLMDFGVDFQGYKTDLTRVFFLGKIKLLVRRVYDIVLKAHDLAISRVRPGAEMAEIDKVARGYIASQGYAGRFVHNLGHGVGLEVHEEPHVSGNEASALKPGMVFTIEPGIYLPGKFGIRIEDMILVTSKGCEVLSGAIN